MTTRPPITTHILDTHRGRPAADVSVQLFLKKEDQWQLLSSAKTNTDGRVESWNQTFDFQEGLYQLVFATGDYFQSQQVPSFYPEVSISFLVAATDEHYHVPLLLSAHGYSTYRGS